MQFERVPIPANGNCFYLAVAQALHDSPDACTQFGLVGRRRADAQHLRNWVASCLLTDREVQGWLDVRLEQLRTEPDMLEDHDFIREVGVDAPLPVLARSITTPGTWASEFEATVVRRLLDRVSMALVICSVPECSARDAQKQFALCEHDRSIFLIREADHYDFMRSDKGAVVRPSQVASVLAS